MLKSKKFFTVKPWDSDEISTRNCYNCVVSSEEVICRLGKSLTKRRWGNHRTLSYNGVVRFNGLFEPCRSCADFDNQWGEGD